MEGVAWIAGRNTVVTAFFVATTLLAHDRWRRNAWAPGAWLVPLSLASALCASEGGLATWGFLA